MRYLMLALLSLTLASPVLVGCHSDSESKTTHNPITGSTTETKTSHTDTNP